MAMAAFLAPALGAPAAIAATATAAPQSPDAIKRQFVAERGVKFPQITRDDDGDTIARGGGVFQFDRSGVIASDITTNFPDGKKVSFETLKAFFGPIRTIWGRGTAYSSGGLYENILDPGQKWLRVPEGSPIGFGNFSSTTSTSSTPPRCGRCCPSRRRSARRTGSPPRTAGSTGFHRGSAPGAARPSPPSPT